MWCPEGYVTLDEIISQLLWDIDQLPLAQGKYLDLQSGEITVDYPETDGEEMDAFIKWACAILFRLFSEDFRVCTFSGTLVRVNPSVLLNVRAGWLGMAPTIDQFPSKYDNRLEIAKWEIPCIDLQWGTVLAPPQYPPLTHLTGAPLCISLASLGVPIQKLAGWLLIEGPKLGNPYLSGNKKWASDEVADQILNAFSTGLVRKKSEAKNMFGKDLPMAAWNALWDQVCKVKPALSQPGPRPK